MSEILQLTLSDIAPDPDAVFERQGIPVGTKVRRHIERLYADANQLLRDTAEPIAVLAEISPSDFAAVYHGEGRNEPETPVGDIFHRADHLSLFTATLGRRASEEITRRFQSNDFALACMLDAAASVAADKAGDVAEQRFNDMLQGLGWSPPHPGVLRYSPGYCGWHISGQKKLFEFLQPERIGVTLRDSFLMEPLKSVSGVIIAGAREIHKFPMSYGFCSDCETHSCRQRLRALYAN